MDPLTPEPSAKTARRVGWIVAFGLVAITLFAVVKHVSMGGLADAEIASGERAIARYIAGDDEASGVAEAAFIDAASVSALDYYPAFGLTVTRRLEELAGGAAVEKPGDSVLVAMLERDWTRARREVDAMRDEQPKRADYYDRLVESVRQASTNSE